MFPSSRPCGHPAKRRQVFILDDSGTMRSHWHEVCPLLDILGYMLKSKDPDGKVQLLFTVNTSGECEKSDSTPLVETAKQHRFTSLDSHVSNMERRLERFFVSYIEKLKPEKKISFWSRASLKPAAAMSVYVFTDGLWRPFSDAANPIRALVKALDEFGMPENHVSLQLIQFGRSAEGTEVLERLDRGLNLSRWVVPVLTLPRP